MDWPARNTGGGEAEVAYRATVAAPNASTSSTKSVKDAQLKRPGVKAAAARERGASGETSSARAAPRVG